jgi:hypothetical protein
MNQIFKQKWTETFSIKSYLVLVSIFILSSCQNNDKLIGTWERYGDELAGMKVKVEKEGDRIIGTIIYSTDKCKQGGFLEGDVKWKSIKEITYNKYEFEDLRKHAKHDRYGNFQKVSSSSYNLKNLEFVSENEIYMISFVSGEVKIGDKQSWKRIKDE